jgi:hypothetical protein
VIFFQVESTIPWDPGIENKCECKSTEIEKKWHQIPHLSDHEPLI